MIDNVPLSILIVEDELDSAQTMAELLILYGYTIRIASCGIDALREIATNPPDVVLLDIGLPGMTGWELAGHLKALPKPPVLVAISGYGQKENYRRSAEVGIHLHLVKPVDPAHLVGMLKRFVRAIASHPRNDCPQ